MIRIYWKNGALLVLKPRKPSQIVDWPTTAQDGKAVSSM